MRQIRITKSFTDKEIARYLVEINKIPLITPDEEVFLAQRIRLGDQRALDMLVKSNLRFVVSTAKKYQNQGLPLSDLVNKGNIGLIKAAQTFDETKGFKFISYAVSWIRQSILRSLAEHSRLVRIPQNKIGDQINVDKVESYFEQIHEREPSTEELSEILEMNITELKLLKESYQRPVSTDAPVLGLENTTMNDLLKDNGHEVDHALIQESFSNFAKKVLSILKPRDAKIVCEHFGIGVDYEMNLIALASKYNFVKENIGRIIKSSKKKILKFEKERHVLKEYLG